MHGIADHIDGFVADLKRRNFRPNTVRAYAADLRTIAHHLTTPLDQITLTAVEMVFDALALEPGREGLRIREPKNGAERIAPLGAKATPKSLRGLRTWLKEFKGQPGYVPLFRSSRGTAVSYAAAQYQWTKLCTAAGLIDEVAGQHHLRYTMHQLRHTRGSELTQQGQPLKIVQRVLGHRDIRSTQGYAELDDLQVRTALEQPPRHQ